MDDKEFEKMILEDIERTESQIKELKEKTKRMNKIAKLLKDGDKVE